MKRLFLAVFLSGAVAALGFAQTSFATAQELFMQNRPLEASMYLEISIMEDPTNVVAFLYLGIVYEQLGMLDEAITVYRQILGNAGHLTANVANNLGNVFFRRGLIEDAEALFSQAIAADRTFASAYLGRANIRLQRGELHEAIADYQQYLIFAPNSPQRPQIEQLITFVRVEFAEVERQRAAAEQAAALAVIQAERQRLAAEEAARVAVIEAERQRIAAEEAAMVAALEAERQRMAAEEAARLAEIEAERQRAAAAEAARLAEIEAEILRQAMAEAARLEAERRQALLDEIAASLQSAAEGSQGLGVGAEGFEWFEGEFELE